MNLLRSIAELSSLAGPVHLAAGVFDGVHLGHQKVIRRALQGAAGGGGSAAVVTFDPHPLRVLRPESAPRLLTSADHKIRLLQELGVETVLVVRFDAAFAAQPAEQFVRALAGAARPLKQICVGYEWRFGRGRAGDIHLLADLGEELGFEVTGIPSFRVGGETASSTLVREAVRAGDFARARQFLGREYTVLGTVVEGRMLGRTLGYPTANLLAHNEQLPPSGVYAVRAEVGGRKLAGVGNLGLRPTVEADGALQRRLEIYFFDFEGDLYGKDVEVWFDTFLRDEERFADLDALRAQIALDVVAARSALCAAQG
ncbi:bifunctional riboflavin kinase/FAD synthetase [soil metagenome]